MADQRLHFVRPGAVHFGTSMPLYVGACIRLLTLRRVRVDNNSNEFFVAGVGADPNLRRDLDRRRGDADTQDKLSPREYTSLR